MKVQFGCGGNILPGWENHDSDVDITAPLPYPDSSVDEVFSEHCMEHVDSHQAVRFLDECLRILKPGGKLRLCIPVIDRLEMAHARDIVFGHGHKATYTTTLLMHLLRITGFTGVVEVGFNPDIDGHWKVIGREKDGIETCRLEAFK